MKVYLGSDHRGFNLKEKMEAFLSSLGYDVADCGNAGYDENDDYVDFAKAVAQKVSKDEGSRGILFCGSGAGVVIAANKVKGIRATLSFSPDHISSARHDDDVNVLCMAADFLGEKDAQKIAEKFLNTSFSGDARFERRIHKITALENENL